MLYRLVAVVLFAAELLLLQAGIGSHAGKLVSPRQFEHAQVQRVEACQRNELEFVAHGPEFSLETRNGGLVQLLLPIERRGAIVG